MADENYSGLLERLQETMEIGELTPDNIARFLAGHDSRGKTASRRRLGSILSGVVQKERQIAVSFTVGEQFAEVRKIRLTENTKASEEKWKGKPVVVIRRNGRFVAWRRL